MQLNGAIDRDLYAVDYKADIYSSEERELNTKGCCAFAVTNLGNVPVRLKGNIEIGVSDCNSRSFPNYLLLDYADNTSVEWVLDGIAVPDARIEVIRIFIIKKSEPNEG